MKSLKVVWFICLQNLRKWKADYRVWTIAVLSVMMVLIYTDDMEKIATGLGTKMPIWIYPFLYSQFHTKLIFTLPILLLFCNAPFMDNNQMFVFLRTGRHKWISGQIMYVIAASAIYYIFLIIVTLCCTLSNGDISMEWGKTLTTTANSNAALYFDSPFIYVSSIVTSFFSPIKAIWFTFILSWMCAIMLGLIIFFCNIVTNTKLLGVIISSLLIVLSALVDSGFPNLLPYSPISWNTIDKIDVGGYTTNPSFSYCVSVYLVLIVLLIAGIFVFGGKQKLDMKGQ